MTELVVVSYNSSWPEMFEKEASLLEASVKSNFIAIHHVGSTSVPGLAAKPILDIILVTHNRHSAVAPLELLGYSNRGEFVIPFRLFLRRLRATLW